jgi:hypothetical protein
MLRGLKSFRSSSSAIADLVGWVESAKPNKNSSLKISAIALTCKMGSKDFAKRSPY